MLLIGIELLVLIFLIFFLLSFFTGGWYTPSPQKIVNKMLELAKLGPDDYLIDLGSGDGRVIIAAGKLGAKAVGIEINPFFYLITFTRIYISGLNKNVKVKLGSFWNSDLSKANVVAIYLPLGSKSLEEKLKRELHKDARIITYNTGFPTLKPEVYSDEGVKLYKLKG